MSHKFNPQFDRAGKPSVCYECPDRCVTYVDGKPRSCHSTCERRAKEVEENKNSARQKEKEIEVFMQNYAMEKKRRR